ncbi:hypothetical protein [Polaribacter ponticola]|uniref:Auto-transporter adhesin head GIN domain-containing protein n=1 Tax=Polaribacter ponticola TaxID=2978475 RepID=A0ABT5SC41_9FLAO|nr:hypothetical protein [Polaribacter sp. MSW5]MDD7915668.1 hypothetical protein [Polaribacter sp. MSW5]
MIKKFDTAVNEIEISTIGLDSFVIENSTSNFIEITLYAENSNKQHIVFKSENKTAQLEFKISEIVTEETVFRKFITKRLQRANASIKIPKDKKVTIFGENLSFESKDYKGGLEVYLEKGIVKLNNIQDNIKVKLYSGNIYGHIKSANISVVSNIGKIKVDDIFYKKTYQKKKKHIKKI